MPGPSTNSPIRLCPKPEGGRVETGPVQFGDDWPGLFIRGDNCMGLYLDIGHILEALDDPKNADPIMMAQAVANLKHIRNVINGQVNLANRSE